MRRASLSFPHCEKPRYVIRRLLPILGITFLDIFGFSILFPIMPYFVEHFGAPKVAVGILSSTYAACQFIGAPIWGHISDRIGRKAVLIISQIGATIGWAMLAFAPTLPWVFLARIIEGLSGGNFSVTQAYVADQVEPQQRARAFGYVGASFSAGIVLGPAMGGLLLVRYGYSAPFLLATGLQVLTLLATIFFLPESVAQKSEAEQTAAPSDIMHYLRDPQIAPVLLQKLTYSLGLFAWFSAYALVLQTLLGFGPLEVSYVFAGSGIISVALQLGVVGRLAEHLGARTASNVGFTSSVLYFILIPHVRDGLGLACVIGFFSFGTSIANATVATLLTDAAPKQARGAILGAGSSLESIAGIIMPTISTATLSLYGAGWTAAVPAFFVSVALLLGLRARNENQHSPG